MDKPEKITMTDGTPYNGMLMRGHSVFKAKSHKGTEITYQEINLDEYDKRVSDLAGKVAKMPGVDLLAVRYCSIVVDDMSSEYPTYSESYSERGKWWSVIRWWYTAKRRLMSTLITGLFSFLAIVIAVALVFRDDWQIAGPMALLGAGSVFILLIIAVWHFKFSTIYWKYRTSHDKRAVGTLYLNRISKSPNTWQVEHQKTGQFYELDLGREHNIIKVHFDCGETCDAPLQSIISFYDKDDKQPLMSIIKSPYIKLPLESDDLRSTTLLTLNKPPINKPIKAKKIRMDVIIPDTDHPWRVNAVYVTVSGVRGLIKHTIGKAIFDRL